MTSENSEDRQSSGPLSADRPLLKLEEDELGYRAFAEVIAAGILNGVGPDGLVIALHGKWGAGKTSAVNMAIDALERSQNDRPPDDRAIIIRFNPWWFSEQQDLVRAFFREVSAAIGAQVSSDVRDGFRKLAKRTSGATELVAGLATLAGAGVAAKPIADAIRAFGDGVDDDRSLEEVRKELSEALSKEQRQLVVVIDDVDRLPGDEARQIFRLVKSVADLPYVTYLLVFDRDIAAQGLERTTDPEGPEWLEKIVQASFDLPPVGQADLNHLLMMRLNAIVGSYEVADMTRWGNILYGAVMPWIRSPRDVGRLSNAIAMLWPSLNEEVDFADLLAVETLRLFEPRLYEFLRTQNDKLTGAEPDRSDRRHLETYGQKILSFVDEGKHERTKRALCYLFPRLDAVFNNTWHGGDWRRAEKEKRIESNKRFPVYFHLGLKDGAIPATELPRILSVLENPTKFRELVEEFASQSRRSGGTRAPVLLDALATEVQSELIVHEKLAARSLVEAGDFFLTDADGHRSPDGFPRLWSVYWVINPVLSRLDPQDIEDVMHSAISGPSLLTAAFLLHGFEKEHGIGSEKDPAPEEKRRLPLAAVERLQAAYIERIERDAISGELLNTRDPATHIYAWRDAAGSEVVRSWTDKLLEQDASDLWLMRTLTSRGVGHAYGDMVGRVTHHVHRKSAGEIVDIDRLTELAQQRVRDENDSDDIAANFLKGLQSTF